MSADRLEIGTRVQAGAAADAIQSFAQHRVLAHLHSAVIHQHQMKLAALPSVVRQHGRPVEWGSDDASVGGHRLPGAAGGKQYDERRQIRACRDYLLHAGYGDVKRR